MRIKGSAFIVRLTILIATFRPHIAGLHQAMMMTFSVRLKRCDRYQSDNRETNNKLNPLIFVLFEEKPFMLA